MEDRETEISRDNSRAADIRARQDDASKVSNNGQQPEHSRSLNESNAKAFEQEALKNGLDLRKIAQEVAEKNAAEAKNQKSNS